MRRFICTLAAALALAAPASAETVLRVSLHSDLKIVDPIWTTALISTHYGNMVYDTLFAVDADLKPQPQMVDKYDVSADKLTWTFTLRDGLEWHDGKPVTGEDCVASIKRWAAKDSMGQKLMSEVSALTAPDAKTIKMVLKEPYGLVLDSLAKPSANMAFMMPKRVADTDPNTQITDYTGSGPFIFKKDEWKPGEKAVFLKNTKYKPRSEPPSGLAGGRVVKVDRVEWITIPDQQTQVNALLNGEIDMVEIVPPDLLPLMQKDKNVKILVVNKAGRQYDMRFNVLHKPFDNAKVREAVLYALDQKPFLEANVGNPDYYTPCKSVFPCGSPLETTKGWEDKLSGNVAKAKELLKEAGYDGTPVVLLHQTDIAGHSQLATVAKPQLEAAGFKVDLQAMDWQTLVARRAKKEPLDKGGWSAYFTSWGSPDVMNPVSAAFINASCDKATFGWTCDEGIEKLRDAFSKETDPAKQKAIAEQVSVRLSGA
ncbi:MAG TPA: ABC transporter substrate-binding protein, partial [Reyranella sp.]